MYRAQKGLIGLASALVMYGCGEVPKSSLKDPMPDSGFISKYLGMQFAFIPAGTFRMGSPKDEIGRNEEETRHWVKLTRDYWMQTREVTYFDWEEIMEEIPDKNPACANWRHGVHEISGLPFSTFDAHRPVSCITLDDINRFIERLNQRPEIQQYTFRLPTEAEWEYAARAYTEAPYSVKGGFEEFAWCGKDEKEKTIGVGKLKSNKFGLHGVHGNVWEWVSDWYGEYPEAEHPWDAVKDPEGPHTGDKKIARGGATSEAKKNCRSATRYALDPQPIYSNVGFRLVMEKK